MISIERIANKRAAKAILAGAAALAICSQSRADAPKFKSQAYVWKSVQIVGGGFVSGIITHPQARGVMYARTDVGGAYRFDAAQKRWTPITDWVSAAEWTYTGIESIAVDPSDPNGVYMAAGTYTNSWSPQNGAIFRSKDQGRSWRRTVLPFKNGGNEDGRSIGERLAVDPNQSKILYFGSRNNGLWRSGDSGATWEQVSSFPVTGRTNGIGIGFVLFDGAAGAKGKATQTLYAGVSVPGVANLYRSADGGATWTALAGQPAGFLPHHAALAKDGSLYVTYGNGPGPNNVTQGAVWKCDAKTGAWTEITPVKPADNDRFGYAGLSLDAQKPDTLVVTSLDRWSRGDDVWRSTDGGKTWTGLRAANTREASAAPHYGGRDGKDFGHWMGDIEIDPFDSNHAMYVTGMGIWATDSLTAADKGEPTRWYPGAAGIEECVVNAVVSPPAGAPLLSATWDIGGFRHDDLDHSPKAGSYKSGHGRNVALDFAERNPDVVVRLFAANGRETGGAYSLDNGVTWTDFPASSGGDGVIAVSADGATFVVTNSKGVQLVSRDRGATWTQASGIAAGAKVVSDRVNPAKFYAISGGTVYRSVDGGATFTAHPAAGLPDGELKATPGLEGRLWASANEGVYFSADGGETFSKLATAQRGDHLGFGKAAPGKSAPALYLIGDIGGVHGFFRSDDDGANWTRINDDLHQFGSVNSIAGDPRVYGRVYIGSSNRGVLYADPAGRRNPASAGR